MLDCILVSFIDVNAWSDIVTCSGKLSAISLSPVTNIEYFRDNFPQERDYLIDLLEAIKTFDDLSDGELKFLANLSLAKESHKELVEKVKNRIPIHYIVQIKRKVEAIDSQTEIIMFTEDLRSDNN